MARQFWNMFNINKDTSNINYFLSHFGGRFKESVSVAINNDDDLKDDMNSFILLLKLRNQLLHEGFLSYKLTLNYEDSYTHYKKAIKLVEFLESKLLEKD